MPNGDIRAQRETTTGIPIGQSAREGQQRRAQVRQHLLTGSRIDWRVSLRVGVFVPLDLYWEKRKERKTRTEFTCRMVITMMSVINAPRLHGRTAPARQQPDLPWRRSLADGSVDEMD